MQKAVRWARYTEEDDTWQKAETFSHQKTISEYWKRLGTKPNTNNNKKSTQITNKRKLLNIKNSL